MMALLKALWKFRPPDHPEASGARLVRRLREKRLLARLEQDWPGGFTLHRTGDLIYVPHPLDARGRHALLHPPRAHPSALAFLGPGAVAIDIGANLGEWTVPLARAVGAGGQVLACEPAPRAAKALAATLGANALRQAEVVRCAVGDHDGSAELTMPVVTSAGTDTGTARIGAADRGHEALSVPLSSLDSLAAERSLDRVGTRGRCSTAEATHRRFRPTLVIETGHEATGDRQAIHDRLRGLGYRMLGILLDYGMAPADWDAYVSLEPPFRRGEAHNLLLVPEKSRPMPA